MYHTRRPLLMTLLLFAIGLRTVFGAPCCLALEAAAHAHAPVEAAQSIAGHDHHHDHAEHDHHAHHEHGDRPTKAGESEHSNHASSPANNPCCSACGPTLPSEPLNLSGPAAAADAPMAEPVRALQTRPPYPAYDATGPPLLI